MEIFPVADVIIVGQRSHMTSDPFIKGLRAIFAADAALKPATVATDAGLDNSTIRKMLKGEVGAPKMNTAARIAQALGRTVEEVIASGAGESAPRPINHDGEAEDGETLVPVWDIEARAGHGAVVPEYEAVAYKLAFPPDYLRSITTVHPSNLEIISVKGKSMVPTLDNDDIVMIDRSKRQIGYDGVFVLRMDDTLHVKRVSRASKTGFVRIISDNRAEFPEFERAVSDIDVIGKVIWAGKRM